MSRTPKGQFAPGNSGRPVGARNKLQTEFVKALAEDFEEHGEGVIRIVRAERPAEYLKIVASILPKEFFVSEGALDGMSDDEIADALEIIRKMRAVKEADTNGSQTVN